ncbi:MAG: phenylalanine--tRNA ligase subunit beta [Candidatus Poseidonia sp.]|nr:phenylalanine--tRNA ligase subunit beta [Poseidonia sp.]
MPTISVPQSLLAQLLGRHGIVHDVERLGDELPLLGTDIDLCDATNLDIEIFPDRPDLLSGETLAYAIRPFLHGRVAEPNMITTESGISMSIDTSLETVRPIVKAAVVRGVETGGNNEEIDAFIKCLMDHQEKLHFALGRGRRRASIGVHDLQAIHPPFRVITASGTTSFRPLGEEQPMTVKEILEQHPKGIDYAHLLEGMDTYPLILDANNAVISFPPIINGNHTTVTAETRDFFVEVTGWDERACEASLMLVCLQLQERGGSVQSVVISNGDDKTIVTPVGEAKQHLVPEELVEKLLGRTFTDEELQHAINRMGGRFHGRITPTSEEEDAKRMARPSPGNQWLQFDMPRWRFDLLHPVDLVEEIAIGHGYEDLGEDRPRAQLTAKPRPDHNIRRRLMESMQGMGFMQIQSLTLSNETDQFTNMRWKPSHEVTMITNPITVDHTMLRQFLLPGLIRLLASNKHHDLPQGVYELGTVVRDHTNCDRLAFLMAERGGGFAAVRGRIQALCNDLGVNNWRAEPLEANDGPWLAGRAAKLLIGDTWVGCFGEIDPAIAMQYELRVPLNGAEFDLGALRSVVNDPV